MTNIVVTGGSGFIGRATIEAAEQEGHSASSFDRAHGNDILGDLSPLQDADYVIHLAGVLGTAELFDEAEQAIINNTVGTLRILQACEKYDLGYVGITMPQVFPSVYTATKIAATRLASAWHKFKGVPVSHVRAFNAFGPGQAHGPGHPQKILPTFATEAWHNRPIPVWGDGTQTVDLVYTGDLARMLVAATNHGDDVTFDGGTGEALSVNQVAEWVIGITASTGGIEYLPMRDGEEPTHIVADGEGWDRLDWKPELRTEDFLAAVTAYRPE